MLNPISKTQQGISMIESLVSLLIISIGLLGIAALQVTSLKQSSSAQWHSQAVWSSYEMTDRISANDAVVFNSYDGIDTDDGGFSMDCTNNFCTTADMVTADAQNWTTQVQQLPGGRGIISSRGVNTNTLDITVMWTDPSGLNNCGALDTVKTCFTVTIRQ